MNLRVRPWLCPELVIGGSSDFDDLFERGERQIGGGVGPPYWAVSWPGGQCLARFVMDNPAVVAGRRVLDLGTGSGLCAIAAASCGAYHVLAADIDPNACQATAANAMLNGVEVGTICRDLVGGDFAAWDVVLAADLWYERFLAMRVNAWLGELAGAGVDVFVGDVGRAYLPRGALVEIARHAIPASEGFERGEQAVGCVYRLKSTRVNAARPPG